MNLEIGYIYKIKNNYVSILIPFHFFSFKYKKLQIRIKKYNIFKYKREYNIGDIVLVDSRYNKVYSFF